MFNNADQTQQHMYGLTIYIMICLGMLTGHSSIWHGLNDREQENVWIWPSGDKVTFIFWLNSKYPKQALLYLEKQRGCY